jgi:hypothetical protein
MTLVYHKLMTPTWLGTHATFRSPYKVQDLRLTIEADTNKFENILKVTLLPDGTLSRDEDVTIKMLVGIELPEPASPNRDPISFMISDGDSAIGFQLQDPARDYNTKGPYVAIDGEPGRELLSPKLRLSQVVRSNARTNPDQFEITLKPTEYWGSAYCSIDDGHKVCCQFGRKLKLNQELILDLYRDESHEVYNLNYVEVWIYVDSPDKVKASDIQNKLK